MKTREEKLIRLANILCSNELDTSPESPEYKILDYLLDDDEVEVLSHMRPTIPFPATALAALSGFSLKKTKKILDGLAEKACFIDFKIPKTGLTVYIMIPYAPGLFEFQMVRPGYAEAHPEVPRWFFEHQFVSHADVLPTNPMGVGIMRVIPVESALPAETKTLTMERLSTLIETSPLQIFCKVPCQCRRVRESMGEATGESPDGMCIYMAMAADTMIRHGRGEQITKEQVYEHLRMVEDLGCIHQITTLLNGMTLAICNCQPSSCMAIGGTAYFNTPNFSRSNYVSEIDAEKCTACGQCVEICPNNALRLGQKICSRTPIIHKMQELPDDLEWGPERWNPEYRDNRQNSVETGSSPCKAKCPAHIAVQGYIRLAAQGKYMEALELIKKENPLPAVCGRICPHDCEDECTRGRIDDPVSIDEIKKFIADKELDAAQRFVPKKTWDFDTKVAVIGSGPAGISCAYFLAEKGYKVTVFEKESKPGGMLTNGIPNFRLDKNVVDAEIDVLRMLGVKFKCGIEVGKDITIPELREQGFKAFYLGIGLQNGGKLGIPGDDAEGVMPGVDFVKSINRGNKVQLSGKVVVIGGGSIGADVARTAIRYGAENVDLYCLESYDEMPMGVEDQAYCKADGITIHDGWGQTEIIKKAGKVSGIRFRRCLSVKNEEGRFDPKFDDKVTEEAQCSTVLYCIGQRPDWGKLLTGVNVELDNRGLVIADPLTYQTSEADIFAGGDIYTGQKFCIDAIAAGKEAAISITRATKKGHSLTIGRNRRVFIPLDKDDIDFDQISWDNSKRQKPGFDPAKVMSRYDERLALTEEQLKAETERCLKCGATVVDTNKCLGCGLCTTRCKFDAIHIRREYNVPIHSLPLRKGFVEKYRKEREQKIAVRKMSEGKRDEIQKG